MISKKGLLLYQKVADVAPLFPNPCTRTLFTYLQYFYFIFLCKCNCKIDHKSKSNGDYTKLTNKWKNRRKWRRAKRYEKLSIELRVQTLPSLEVKRYKKLRRIIANAGYFTGQ